MEIQSLVYVMTAAVLLQACFLGVMALAAWKIKGQVDALAPRAQSLMTTAEQTLTDSKKRIDDITTKASDIMDSTKKQVQRSEEFLTEATGRARIQLDRIELVLDDTISRAHETAVLLNQGVLRPVRELNGLVVGIRSALHYLVRGSRPSPDQATTDEEMFI